MSEEMLFEYATRYRTKLGDIHPKTLATRIDGITVEAIVENEIRAAASAAVDAGYSGSWTDGGADARITALHNWVAGLEGRVPDSMKESHREMQKVMDPEYAEYERLREKFES